jgi:transposase
VVPSQRRWIRPTHRPLATGRVGMVVMAPTRFTGARRVVITHRHLKAGDHCPGCLKGKIYGHQPPARLVRLIGQAPIAATVYELEKLRCNLCGEIFTAEAPPEVGPDKYDATAASMIAVLKYGAGVPFARLAGLQQRVEIPLPEATQWEIVHEVAMVMQPAFHELLRHAAQGEVVYNDDTSVPVLALRRERVDGRTGVFTSGIVSTREGRQIALYFTGGKHAGENLATVLAHRAATLPPPIQMCDALARNLPTFPPAFETIVGYCLAHARRRFVNVTPAFPAECRYVLETLGAVYQVDAQARAQRLSPEARLQRHQADSAPRLTELRAWFVTQLEEHRVEPNSGLGQAITYFLKHWDRLTLFLRVPGAPLDNNICERALKKAILHRNYVYPPIMWRCPRRHPVDGAIGERSRIPGAHNHRASKKAMRRSPARNVVRPESGVVTLSIARFFIARSASMYMWVVAVLSCPSQSAMTVMSTPDCRRCMAVECRTWCGVTWRSRRLGHSCRAPATAASKRERIPTLVKRSPRRFGKSGCVAVAPVRRSQSSS